MFDIIAVELDNFRSFTGHHQIKLPAVPGLYHLTGRNLKEPRLEANGVGKSSLLEAIHWALYGKTSRGLRGNDIVSRGAKSTAVSVKMRLTGGPCVVKRVQTPNSLTLDGRVISQEELHERLGLTPQAFVYSVMTPQFGRAFLDLEGADKLKLFTAVMDLDYWVDKSYLAAEQTGMIADKMSRQLGLIASIRGACSSLESTIQTLKVQDEEFEKTQHDLLDKYDKSLAKFTADLQELTAERKLLNDNLLSLKVPDQKLHKQAAAESHAMLIERAKIGSKIDDLTAWLRSARTIKGVCPTCAQSVDAGHIAEHVASTTDKLAELRRLSDTLARKQANADALHTKLLNEYSAVCAEREACLNRLSEISHFEREAQARRKSFGKSMADEKARINPYHAVLMTTKANLEARKRELTAATQKLDSLGSEYEHTNFWVTGFKRVRLYAIEEALQTLELEVSNAMTSLGLPDWQISFDVERENKAGGVTRGFIAKIICPWHPAPVKWESWSGGETVRLRQAVDFGLASLIMTRAGLTGKIEFYDEPSAYLSPAGLLDLAEALQSRADQSGKRIFLIDHHIIDYGDFAGVLNITKDAEGSHCDW